MSVRVGYGQGRYNKGLFNQTLGTALSANAVAALSTTVSAFTRLRTLAGTVLGAGTFVAGIQRIQNAAASVAATASAVSNYTVALGIDFVATTAAATMSVVIRRIQSLATVASALSTIAAVFNRLQPIASVASASASGAFSIFGTFVGGAASTASSAFISSIRHLYIDTGFSTTTFSEQVPSTKTYTEQTATTKTYSAREV